MSTTITPPPAPAGGQDGGKADGAGKGGPKLDAGTLPETELVEAPFPAQVRREFRIHFDPTVHDTILRHAAETTEVELCGVLVGAVRRDRHGPYLHVSGSIRGEFAQNDGAQVKFTHETWDHIHRVKEERYPKDPIVGWYHTHPGFGVFLSSMDTFIHEYFFNTAGQVALVVDPRSGDEGVFVWEDGAVARSARFWIGDRERRCATGPVNSPPAPAQRAAAAAGGASAPRATTSTSGQRDEARSDDEFDLFAGASDLLRKAGPVLLGALLGFVLARAFVPGELHLARNDLLRSELRALIGEAAQAWSMQDDLRAVESRLGELRDRASTAPVTSSELAQLTKVVGDLRAATGAREAAIAQAIHRRGRQSLTLEDELRLASADAASARRLALEAYLQVIRSRLDAVVASGKALSPDEAAMFRGVVEAALSVSANDSRRAALREQFPELYPDPPAAQPSTEAAPPAPPPAGPPATGR